MKAKWWRGFGGHRCCGPRYALSLWGQHSWSVSTPTIGFLQRQNRWREKDRGEIPQQKQNHAMYNRASTYNYFHYWLICWLSSWINCFVHKKVRNACHNTKIKSLICYFCLLCSPKPPKLLILNCKEQIQQDILICLRCKTSYFFPTIFL